MIARLRLMSIEAVLKEYHDQTCNETEALEAIAEHLMEVREDVPVTLEAVEKPVKKPKKPNNWSPERRAQAAERMKEMRAAKKAKRQAEGQEGTASQPSPEVLELAKDMFKANYPMLPEADMENHWYWKTCLEEATKELS
jgi:hypothetical protein